MERFKGKNLLKTAGILAGATLVGTGFRELLFPETNNVVIYIFAVLLTARFTSGYLWGLISSIAAVLCYNYFFTAPYHTLAVNDPSYFVTFVIMVITAVMTSALTTKGKLLKEKAEENASVSRILYDLSSRLSDAADMENIMILASESVGALFQTEAGCICFTGETEPFSIWKCGDGIKKRKEENWEKIKGDITFEDVSFRYPDGKEYVLEHFNLHIPAGTNVAIVGETGAGKSTLVNLVGRFFEPTKGRILIDGVDYRERSQLWLHSQMGYVLQNPHLFSGTVRENIRYGRLDATEEEIRLAAERVSADEVVKKMEKEYDSDVGESGGRLSTGEKQLISFARAILADPSIFVLDEATSSIDTVTEQLIQNATETLLKGHTSFVIAHRLSTIKNADLILVVKDGKIIERGTHKELLAQEGYYQTLYYKQFEEESVLF